jgi:lipoyl(octanoyl) transferase
MKGWCGREDSNFHGNYPTATSTLRVYQFRHDRMKDPTQGALLSCQGPRAGIPNDPVPIKPGEMEQIQPLAAGITPDWRLCAGLLPYEEAVAEMERRVAEIGAGRAPELIWLVEHPPLFTAGTGAKPEDLLIPGFLPVFKTGRGGQYTYHGPGQRVAYVMLDLRRRNISVRGFVRALESWVVAVLAQFGVAGEPRAGRVGIWVADPGNPKREDKIAAIGVRLKRGITYHGLSINLDPDLSQYRGINPCGIPQSSVSNLGVTSLAKLGVKASMRDIDAALMACFEEVFPA